MIDDTNNLLLSEEPGPSPEVHLQALEELKKISQRYFAIREFILASPIDQVLVGAHLSGIRFENRESFDSAADLLIEAFRKISEEGKSEVDND